MPPTGTVSAKKAEEQMAELQPQPVEAKEPPKSAAPGSHPLRTVEDDAEALRRYRGASAEQPSDESGLWHTTAYGGRVFVPGDRFPSGSDRASSARGGD